MKITLVSLGVVLSFCVVGCYTQETLGDDYSVLEDKDVRAITVHTQGGNTIRSEDWKILTAGTIEIIGGSIQIPRDSIRLVTFERLNKSGNQVLAIIAVTAVIAILIALPATTIWPD